IRCSCSHASKRRLGHVPGIQARWTRVAFVSRAAITESFGCPLWAAVQQSAHPNSDSDSSGGKPCTRRTVVVPERLRTRVRDLLGPPLARRCDLSIQGPVGYGGLGFLQVFRASSAGAQKLNT